MKKWLFSYILLIVFFQSCSQNKNVATVRFSASIFFSDVDYILQESYGSALNLKIKFPREYSSLDNTKFSEKELQTEKNGGSSISCHDELRIKSDSSNGKVPFQLIISDYFTEHIFSDSLYLIHDFQYTYFMYFDISTVRIAEIEWNINKNNASHTIWIKNDSTIDKTWGDFKVDSIYFLVTYYSDSDVELEERIISYNGNIPTNEVTEIKINISNLKNPKITKGSRASIKKVFYSKNHSST